MTLAYAAGGSGCPACFMSRASAAAASHRPPFSHALSTARHVAESISMPEENQRTKTHRVLDAYDHPIRCSLTHASHCRYFYRYFSET
eukprot:1192062-Prorocentrum_minimum.AAC.2